MRGKIFLSASAIFLAGTAFALLKMGPSPVVDREIPVAEAPDSVAAAVIGPGGQISPQEGSDQASTSAEEAATNPSSKQMIGTINSVSGISNAESQAYMQAPPLSEKEKKSVSTMLTTFFKYKRGKRSLNNLIKELTALGLEPVLAKDFNAYTGKMLTIRTNEALEGTRYFHAQYFEDDDRNKEPFRQHTSFEVRPSPDGMSVAKKMVEDLLGKKIGPPTSQRGDEWVEWKHEDETVWIKRLTAQDLNSDLHNARTKDDIGTCLVTVQQIVDEHH